MVRALVECGGLGGSGRWTRIAGGACSCGVCLSAQGEPLAADRPEARSEGRGVRSE